MLPNGNTVFLSAVRVSTVDSVKMVSIHFVVFVQLVTQGNNAAKKSMNVLQLLVETVESATIRLVNMSVNARLDSQGHIVNHISIGVLKVSVRTGLSVRNQVQTLHVVAQLAGWAESVMCQKNHAR